MRNGENLSAEMQLLITTQALIHLLWWQFGRWTLFTAKAVWGALGGSHQSPGYLQKEPMHWHQFQSPCNNRWYGKLLHNSFLFFFCSSRLFFFFPQGSVLLMCLPIIIIFPKNIYRAMPFGSLAVWHLMFLISIFN